jgi:hypothetical protein
MSKLHMLENGYGIKTYILQLTALYMYLQNPPAAVEALPPSRTRASSTPQNLCPVLPRLVSQVLFPRHPPALSVFEVALPVCSPAPAAGLRRSGELSLEPMVGGVRHWVLVQ